MNERNERIRKAVRAALFSLAALVFTVVVAELALAGGHKRISGAELVEMMGSVEDLVVVDVREPWLFKRGHVPGSVNIPFDTARQRVLKELSPGDTIVFVCHGGPMGDELGELLVENGYTRVYNLTGGMRRWRGPVER